MPQRFQSKHFSLDWNSTPLFPTDQQIHVSWEAMPAAQRAFLCRCSVEPFLAISSSGGVLASFSNGGA
jgi:hypothetical protein